MDRVASIMVAPSPRFVGVEFFDAPACCADPSPSFRRPDGRWGQVECVTCGEAWLTVEVEWTT